jgi:hypothetical protein
MHHHPVCGFATNGFTMRPGAVIAHAGMGISVTDQNYKNKTKKKT